jgi:hypothetical protein
MVLKAKHAIIPLVGLAMALQATGCKKDKDSNTDLLVGEWELVKIDGVTPTVYSFSFEFEENFDMKLCEIYGSQSSCYNGEWEWGNADEDEVDFTWDDGVDSYEGSIEIDELSKDKLEGDLTIDGETYQVEFEKVN